jgi:3-oxoacyl-[acyl-carrier-protein] synthase II
MVSPVFITGAEAVCGLGNNLAQCLGTWSLGGTGLSSGHAIAGFEHLPVGSIAERQFLKGRRYGAASNLAVHVARRAVESAGWSGAALAEAWIFAASSRGNAGELLGAHAWRRPMRRLRASNSIHSEIAAAVSIELGVQGPWQLLSNGCASGMDALGLAAMAVGSGQAPRALVLASELPLVPELLRDFADAGLLAKDGLNDPFSEATTGFLPGEAGVAVTLEAQPDQARVFCSVERYGANSDAYDSLATPEDGRALGRLLQAVGGGEAPALICTHTTGTRVHAVSELNGIRGAFLAHGEIPLLPLKPLTGHTLGASGLLDVALLAGALRSGGVPCAAGHLSAPPGFRLATRVWTPEAGRRILKIASGMGGHNAAVLLGRP